MNYEPELGQLCFGQPFKEYKVSDLVIAALHEIDDKLSTVMWNIYQKEYSSPFSNTGNSFKCDTFEVEAYSWNDAMEQPYNFKWKDVEISWYKYLGRGVSSNIEISPELANQMLNECLEAVYRLEKDRDTH